MDMAHVSLLSALSSVTKVGWRNPSSFDSPRKRMTPDLQETQAPFVCRVDLVSPKRVILGIAIRPSRLRSLLSARGKGAPKACATRVSSTSACVGLRSIYQQVANTIGRSKLDCPIFQTQAFRAVMLRPSTAHPAGPGPTQSEHLTGGGRGGSRYRWVGGDPIKTSVRKSRVGVGFLFAGSRLSTRTLPQTQMEAEKGRL